MKSVTIEQILSWKKCAGYTDDVVRFLFAGRKYLTWDEIFNLEIPYFDRIWCILSDVFFEPIEQRLIACDFAMRLIPFWEQWANPGNIDLPRKLIISIRNHPDNSDSWSNASNKVFDYIKYMNTPTIPHLAITTSLCCASFNPAYKAAYSAAKYDDITGGGNTEKEWQMKRIKEALEG